MKIITNLSLLHFMRKIVMSIGMMLLCIWGYAQELPTVVPPSPEAVSLAKFTEIPVSHYTGLPTIGVPLYEVNFEGISIPVGLSYHARGVKVEEIASRVGIGWALNAGGSISRQIRGKNDFAFSTYGYFNGNFYSTFESNPGLRQSIFSADANGEVDLIPDQFTFNFFRTFWEVYY